MKMKSNNPICNLFDQILINDSNHDNLRINLKIKTWTGLGKYLDYKPRIKQFSQFEYSSNVSKTNLIAHKTSRLIF